MLEATLLPLKDWENFYVIIGSAAATLTGLMFIVITLVAGIHTLNSTSGIAAFSTPNVVHFCCALLIAAILSAPWQMFWNIGLLLGLTGLGGAIYVIIVLQRARHQDEYQPVLEDWLWHTIFPFTAYVAIVAAAVILLSNPEIALFIIGAATILLIFIGIHNAWDTIAYMVIQNILQENKSQNEEASDISR
jgi:hypothetical protein